ncbi:AsnC family transcriptional regulator [Candidatus Pacearchaeota archaeon]|nr:AsnC family transcriptional regulator [Candidatus Pacearchaeota archaeon]
MVKIDLKDKRILAELDMNARIPITSLAKKVGLSRQAVEYRIRRLQKENVIFNSLTIFDTAVVGFNWYRVILRFQHISKNQKEEFIEYLKNNKYTFWVGEVGGNWDLIINFICKDNFEFNEIFEKISQKYGSFIKDYEILIYINVFDLQRNYILDKKEKRKEIFHKMKFNSEIKLDCLDRGIIKMIKTNALISNFDISKKLNVSPNTIKNRICSMVNSGLLLGFRTLINPIIFGYRSHLLFFSINHIDVKKEEEFYSYLKSIPNITYLVKHIGRWRIGMEVETKSDEEFHEIFTQIRGKFSEIITDFESFPLYRDHKIDYFPEGNLV